MSTGLCARVNYLLEVINMDKITKVYELHERVGLRGRPLSLCIGKNREYEVKMLCED